MGHSCELQGAFSELDPGQAAPPLDGAGLLQSLVWDWVPPPQVTVQVENELQAPQFPSKRSKTIKIGKIFKTRILMLLHKY